MEPYDHNLIEKQAQTYWQESNSFNVKEDPSREKFYCLAMLPYPSGELHMGHVRNYTIPDVITRYQRMLGKNVLQPMGWDAFGLPAENAALKNQVAPSKWTYQNIKDMRGQLQRLGYGIDWQREISTCSPEYYRWEQWLFTRMYKKGLAYRKNALVNWDPVDNTVLANEQVINGRGWRSGALVERREISQWFLKITDYTEQLLQDLNQLSGWPEQVRRMQENWIGKSQGLEIDFNVANTDEMLHVFTTRPDTLMGASYLAIAPEHPLAKLAAENHPNIRDFLLECQHIKVSEAELATIEKKGVDSGWRAIHPITREEIPIWIANYVLMEYGSGAVMAVPAHDERDHEFASKYNLPIVPVIAVKNNADWDFRKQANTEKGILINSSLFDSLNFDRAFAAIAEHLIAQGQGRRITHYRLRDWGISRQRYWGTPIPMIYCCECGIVPVPDQDLPVVLPEDVTLENFPASPLKSNPDFYQTTCPVCGRGAQRETDTFDTFVESSWYYARYTCPDQFSAMLDERAHYWLGVDQYVGGIEHAVLHLLYARFFYKVLRDEGLVQGDEPFRRLLTQGMVLKDGAKMSKSKGNTVSPKDMIDRYGADTVRLFIIFTAPPEQSLEWSDSGVEGSHRFLKRLWSWSLQNQAIIQAGQQSTLNATHKHWRKEIHENLQQANFDMERLQLNTVVSAAMKLFNALSKIPPSEETAAVLVEGTSILLRLLSPITPHITHHLWRRLGFGDDILNATWPEVDTSALETDSLTLAVQINGKLRGTITVPVNADEDTIRSSILADESLQRHLAGSVIKKMIVVPKKLVSLVV